MLTVADAKDKDIATTIPSHLPEVTTVQSILIDTYTATPDTCSVGPADPSLPPQDDTCHFMRLPPELRFTIAENVFKDLFAKLECGRGSPFHMISADPLEKEVFAMLHVNRALRVENIDLYVGLAKVWPTRLVFLDHVVLCANDERRSRVLELLQKAKLSIVGA